MCSRFYYKKDFPGKLKRALDLEGIPYAEDLMINEDLKDILPSEKGMTISAPDHIIGTGEMIFGFSCPYDKGLIINARSETAREKRMFSEGILNRRCIIPASGFYEWDAYKARFRFTEPEGNLIFMAGIYRKEPSGLHYVILTSEANRSMAPVHDRMPVMIEKEEIRPWLLDDLRTDEILRRSQKELKREQDSGQISMIF